MDGGGNDRDGGGMSTDANVDEGTSEDRDARVFRDESETVEVIYNAG